LKQKSRKEKISAVKGAHLACHHPSVPARGSDGRQPARSSPDTKYGRQGKTGKERKGRYQTPDHHQKIINPDHPSNHE
jgi:hypothetical protein